MKLESWERFQELHYLKKEMNRLFDWTLGSVEPRSTDYQVGFPAIEIQEGLDTLSLKIEIPGISSKNIELRVGKQQVKVRDKRLFKPDRTAQSKVCSELHYGEIERTIPLPSEVDPDKTVADYVDGILVLKLEKSRSIDSENHLDNEKKLFAPY